VNHSPLIASAVEILRQGEDLLNAIDDDRYTRRLPAVFNSAVGGHYRHCLDHFQCLLDGMAQGEVNYDHRRRDAQLENHRKMALAETRRLRQACEKIPPRALELPIHVLSKVSYEGESTPLSASSVSRELIYAVAHAIHHYALLAVMCSLLGVRVPFGFGIAPSTLQHWRTGAGEADPGPSPAPVVPAPAGITDPGYNDALEEKAA
jgi:hypothetical protein